MTASRASLREKETSASVHVAARGLAAAALPVRCTIVDEFWLRIVLLLTNDHKVISPLQVSFLPQFPLSMGFVLISTAFSRSDCVVAAM
jgi:hypothetical protein